MSPESTIAPEIHVQRKSPDVVLLKLRGNWRRPGPLPGFESARDELQQVTAAALQFDTSELAGWDSRFLVFISKCQDFCRERGIAFRSGDLPEGVDRLLRLASASPENLDASRKETKAGWLAGVGHGALKASREVGEMLRFLGEMIVALGKLLRGGAQFRWADALLVMQKCGPEALGIVALINFLVGLIIAFVAAVSLLKFGAAILVADMVAIGTVREMGCLMTGIILCGRTGAAFAAQLGTMKVNEEITALETFGFSPIEFLVLPRMVALVLMMPLLCLFADLVGILGGFSVSVLMLDVTATEYLNRTLGAIQLTSFLLGVGKGAFFGFLVAYTGCLRGMQCGNTAAAVGEATTRAVVAGITAIIAADGIFAVICNALNI